MRWYPGRIGLREAGKKGRKVGVLIWWETGEIEGDYAKNVKYLALEKGLKGGMQGKKEGRECKVPKMRGLGTYNPSPSPFLISYLPADIRKRSQESSRRGGGVGGGGEKGELRNSLVSPLFTPSFHGSLLLVRWHTVNPLLGPTGGLIFWRGGGKAYSIFNLEKTIASVLHTELEYKVEKF